jgi:2-alkenal reductase
MMPLSPSIAEVLREAGEEVPVDYGLLIYEVKAGGPAAKAGIRGARYWARISRRSQLPAGGDIITAIDDRPTTNLQTLMIYLEMEKSVGDTVELTVLRDGESQIVPVVLGEQAQGW